MDGLECYVMFQRAMEYLNMNPMYAVDMVYVLPQIIVLVSLHFQEQNVKLMNALLKLAYPQDSHWMLQRYEYILVKQSI